MADRVWGMRTDALVVVAVLRLSGAHRRMVYVVVRRHESHVGGEDVLATRAAPKADVALLHDPQYVTGGRNAVVVTAVAVQRTRGEVAASGDRPAEALSSSVLLVLVGRVREAVVVLVAYTVARAVVS